jgi:kynurenine formamidase
MIDDDRVNPVVQNHAVTSLLELLTRARVYDLARPLERSTPVGPNHPPFWMALVRRHGDAPRDDGSSSAQELLSLGGHTGTHIDALSHFSLAGKLHGGRTVEASMREGRFGELGVETIAPLVCRGVLLDVPGAAGRDALEPAEPISAADLERTCDVHGIDVRAGDAVLVRTGWPVGRFHDAAAYNGAETGVPGPDESAARWLGERRIRVTGSDTLAYEHLPPGAGQRLLPAHVALLVEYGVHIVEVLDLEELARDGVHEFVFVALPLKLVGATGSPIRPVALVG